MKEERTGWRDAELSLEHRRWGHDCPMVDVDFLCIEYDRADPKAIIEYKKDYNPEDIDLEHPSYRALLKMAVRCGIPFYIVCYAENLNRFQVSRITFNGLAQTASYNRLDYVRFLYRLRGNVIPYEVERYLKDANIRTDEEISKNGTVDKDWGKYDGCSS